MTGMIERAVSRAAVGLARPRFWFFQLGSSGQVARDRPINLPGAHFHLSRVQVGEALTYAHAVDRHMLYATLSGATTFSRGRIGTRSATDRPDRRGLISLTPAGWERRVEIGPGSLLCAHIAIDADHDATTGATRWEAPFNVTEPKLFAMMEALAAAAAGGDGDRLLAETLLDAVARRVGRRYGGASARTDDGWLAPAALRRVIDTIEAHAVRAPRLATLAAEAGLGVSAFVRAFRGTTGRTPADFAMERRLNHAERSMRASDQPLALLAAELGFCSASHLVNVYRKRRGRTPGALRAASSD